MYFFSQRSTKHTPYCALFGRHPRTPGVINNTTQEKGDDDKRVVVIEETEEDLEAKAADIAELHAKVMVKRKYMSMELCIMF